MRKLLVACLMFTSATAFASVSSIRTSEELSGLTSQGVTVVDFYADWCGPCKKIGPILDRISDETSSVNFAKVNTDHSSLGKEYNVSGLPTVILFVNGQEVNRFVGYKDEGFIRSFIKKGG
jgi:thioredoxin 1